MGGKILKKFYYNFHFVKLIKGFQKSSQHDKKIFTPYTST